MHNYISTVTHFFLIPNIVFFFNCSFHKWAMCYFAVLLIFFYKNYFGFLKSFLLCFFLVFFFMTFCLYFFNSLSSSISFCFVFFSKKKKNFNYEGIDIRNIVLNISFAIFYVFLLRNYFPFHCF